MESKRNDGGSTRRMGTVKPTDEDVIDMTFPGQDDGSITFEAEQPHDFSRGPLTIMEDKIALDRALAQQKGQATGLVARLDPLAHAQQNPQASESREILKTVDLIRSCRFFSRLTDEEIETLAREVVKEQNYGRKTIPESTTIITRKSSASNGFYILLAPKAVNFEATLDSEIPINFEIEQGTGIGELALLSQANFEYVSSLKPSNNIEVSDEIEEALYISPTALINANFPIETQNKLLEACLESLGYIRGTNNLVKYLKESEGEAVPPPTVEPTAAIDALMKHVGLHERSQSQLTALGGNLPLGPRKSIHFKKEKTYGYIVQGSVEIATYDEQGRRYVLATLSPGQVIGELKAIGLPASAKMEAGPGGAAVMGTRLHPENTELYQYELCALIQNMQHKAQCAQEYYAQLEASMMG